MSKPKPKPPKVLARGFWCADRQCWFSHDGPPSQGRKCALNRKCKGCTPCEVRERSEK
jgi:hypothetical protein